MRIILIILLISSTILKAQTPYSHPVITVQSGRYITNLAQANNTDTNIVLSSTTVSGSYMGQKNGTALQPIVIVNQGGPVTMTGGIAIENCSYIEIIGWGSNDAFGFQYLTGNSSGVPVHIIGKSHHITIKGFKLKGGNAGGVWAKTEVDEVANKYNCDLSYLTTPMTYITLSCNWLENCGGEAYYIGSTGWAGRQMNCGGVITTKIPQQVGYIHCDSNIIINSGRTGAQMSGSISNTDNYGTFIGNKVYYAGRGLESSQGVGLAIGGSFRNATVTNNYVHNTWHYNYYITGYGNTIFENNFGDSSTYWKSTHNQQPLAPAYFATSLSPVTWKITNNEMIGGTAITNGHPTHYAVYSDNKNTDTGNIICNNIGTVDVFGPLIYSNTCSAPSNIPPVVNAGANVSITLPTTTVNLSGTAMDADGTISSTLWTNTDGCSITSASSLTTTATCSILGAHVFTLTATDNAGATTQDAMIATVNAAVNIPPTANAAANQTVYLPLDSLVLTQSGTDPDGTIANQLSYIIQTFFGATVSRETTLTPALKGLTDGDTIKIVLRVTDDDSAYGYDTTTIIVLDTTNAPPVAQINTTLSTTLNAPVGQLNIDGSSSYDLDPNDYISAYLWEQVSGNAVTITDTAAQIVTLEGFATGVYVFRLTVTDSRGATDSIDFTINVYDALRFKQNKAITRQ